MKKKIARMLAVLMLLSSVVIPTGGEKPACAATKIPKLVFTGGIENIKCMLETGIVQKVGKTVTATVKNVKKGNVKDITVYNYDPRVATVTGKIVTKKKSGFKVNIKKLGVTSLRVRLTLKKKQAGLKLWWMNVDVAGVRELSKKELKALSKKYPEANTHSALLKKYDSYKIHYDSYDVKGNRIQEGYTYYNQNSYYSYDKFKKDNKIQHDYYESNTGYVIFGENNDFSEYYYCELFDNYRMYSPFPDDPERFRKQIEQYDPEYGYSDGEHYYYSDVSNSKAESWIRGEAIIDVKTNELVSCVFYTKNKKGKVYKFQSQRVETAVEMPDIYQFLKYRYTAEGKKKVKWECIIDPGTQDERHISLDIQEGAGIKAFFPDGYEMFMDAAGKIPFAYPVDTSKDITIYIIKTAEDGSADSLA